MKLNFLVLSFFLLSVALCARKNVIEVTEESMNKTLSEAPFVLLEFYAPWCGHCKKFAPEYEKAAGKLIQLGIGQDQVILAKIDGASFSKVSQRYGVGGFPTVKVFRAGEVVGEYDGLRQAENVVHWVKSNSGPAIKNISTATELEELKKEADILVVGFFYSIEVESKDIYSNLQSVANQMRSRVSFAIVTDEALMGDNKDKIKVFKHFDEPEETLDVNSSLDLKALTSFILSKSVPLMGEITGENFRNYYDQNLPLLFMFAIPNDAASDEAKAEVGSLAKDYQGKVSFTYIDALKFSSMSERMGVQGNKFPALVISHGGGNYVFNNGTITAASVKVFTDMFIEGNLQRSIQSEHIPEEETVNGLTDIVGNTFKRLISDNMVNDILLEFYLPSCGHCQKMAPDYAKVAKALENQNTIMVARLNAASNEFDRTRFPVQGFPTIFFIPKGGEPILYSGNRSAEDMLEFVRKHIKSVEEITTKRDKDEL